MNRTGGEAQTTKVPHYDPVSAPCDLLAAISLRAVERDRPGGFTPGFLPDPSMVPWLVWVDLLRPKIIQANRALRRERQCGVAQRSMGDPPTHQGHIRSQPSTHSAGVLVMTSNFNDVDVFDSAPLVAEEDPWDDGSDCRSWSISSSIFRWAVPAGGTGCFVVLATCHALVGCNREMVFVLV